MTSMSVDELTQRYRAELDRVRQEDELPRKHGNTLLGTIPEAVAEEFAEQGGRKEPITLAPTSDGLVDVILSGDSSRVHKLFAEHLITKAQLAVPGNLKFEYLNTIQSGSRASPRAKVRARTAGSLCAGRRVEAGTWLTKEPEYEIWNSKTGGDRTAIEVSCLREKPHELLYSAMLWSQQAQTRSESIVQARNTIAVDVNPSQARRRESWNSVAVAVLTLPAAQEGVSDGQQQGTLTLMNASADFQKRWRRVIREAGLQVMIISNANSVSLPLNFFYRALPRCTRTVEISVWQFAEEWNACLKRDEVRRS